jgi:calpain-13
MAHDAETSVVKFKNQDFRTLRDHCLSRGQLFIDDTFPAAASSIGEKLLRGKHLSKLEWKRPTSKVSEPHLGAQKALQIWRLSTMASP